MAAGSARALREPGGRGPGPESMAQRTRRRCRDDLKPLSAFVGAIPGMPGLVSDRDALALPKRLHPLYNGAVPLVYLRVPDGRTRGSPSNLIVGERASLGSGRRGAETGA